MRGPSRSPPGPRSAKRAAASSPCAASRFNLAAERERTRRLIVFALLAVIGLVALGPVVCIAVGRLSVADVNELYVALGWLTTLASPPLAFFFAGARGSPPGAGRARRARTGRPSRWRRCRRTW
jgi:hypothetical protein